MSIFSDTKGFLVDLMGPLGPLIAVGLLGMALVIATLPMFLAKKEDPLDRLKRQRLDPNAAKREPTQALRVETKHDKLEKYAGFLEPQDEEELSNMQLKLLRAGYTGANAVRSYFFLQFALALLGLAMGGIYAYLKSQGVEAPTQSDMLQWVLGPGVVGYMAPKYWVTRRSAEREEMIINGFPDSLDMMLVCVEAGQSLDQSIIRVSEELRASYPPLADEFQIVAYEMKAGKDKASVLKDMSERCGVSDISSFTTVLVQSQTFGTSIADALRVYAEEMRDKRVMRAEEKANKLPTKMTLATMMFTLPPLMIVLIGPSLVGMADSFSQF